MQSVTSVPYLSLSIWVPILFGLFILAFGRDRSAGAVRAVALIGALAGFIVTLPLYAGFDPATADMQFVELVPWIERFAVNYALGIDGISLWFVLLTAFITILVVLAGWEVIETNVAQYMASFLILSGIMIGVFCALDGLLFYVFFEATLIPMFIIIGVWGWAKACLCGVEILSVYLSRLIADVDRFHLFVVPGWWEFQHSRLARSAVAA